MSSDLNSRDWSTDGPSEFDEVLAAADEIDEYQVVTLQTQELLKKLDNVPLAFLTVAELRFIQEGPTVPASRLHTFYTKERLERLEEIAQRVLRS